MVRTLITLMGPSLWGMFNSIWAMIRIHGFVPQKIHILGSKDDQGRMETARSMITSLIERYGPSPEISFRHIKGDDVGGVKGTVQIIVDQEEGSELALDVTPGRKAVVLGSILVSVNDLSFDHIYYLYIESLRNASRPYMLIPLTVQHSHDIMEEGRNAADRGG